LTRPLLVEELPSVDPARPGRRLFSYEAHYQRNRLVLVTLVRRLYAGSGPSFPMMQQGEIGDCYFFSVTGYLVDRDPGRIVRMIQPRAGGGYLVRFENGDNVPVPEPTDAEVLVNNSSSSLRDGLWLPVLEIAVGEVLRIRAQASGRTIEPTDAMASGGDTVMVMHLYSGHLAAEWRLRRERSARALIPDVRESLSRVLARGMLAAADMGKTPPEGGRPIPGLGYDHSYAILAYDPGTDQVTMWNPWGHSFKPRGPEGVEYGFSTEHGTFRLPLTTLCEQFSVLQLETFDPTVDAF
jgi:hypothetical protein